MPDANEKMRILEETLEAMILENITITSRSVISRLGGVLRNPSDITRNEKRNKLFVKFKDKQRAIRARLREKVDASPAQLAAQNAKLLTEVDKINSEKELLIASHRAAIIAIGEMGGAPLWLKFYKNYTGALNSLHTMGAVPENVVGFPADQ